MKTKLFFIINSFSWGGGAESLLTTIMNALDDTGRYEIGVMEIIHADVKKEPINKSIKVYPYYTDADAPDRKERMYYVYHEWDKVIKEYIPDDYDVYISFNYLKPSFLLPPDKKNIAWIHGDIYDLINRYPNQTKDMSEERELQREAFKKANRIIAISDITKQSIEDIYPEQKNKIILLANKINVNRIKSMSEEKTDIKLEGYAIVFAGRFDTNKNPLRAVSILRKLLKVRKDAHLYLVGYGVLEQELIQTINENGLENNVHILGYFDNPFPVFRQASLMLVTSLSEGGPLVILEGLALGKAFVSTDVGISRKLSENQNVGGVFNEDDEATSEIIRLAETDPETIKSACTEVISMYDTPEYIRRIESIIQDVILEK